MTSNPAAGERPCLTEGSTLRRLLAILAVSATLTPAVALANDRAVEVLSAQPVPLEFDDDRTASIDLLIVNRTDEAADMAAQIWDPEVGAISEGAEAEADSFAIVSADPASIRAGETDPVTIVIQAGTAVELVPNRADGLLLLIGSTNSVPVSLVIPPQPRALADAKVEPSSATFTALCPHPLSCESDNGLAIEREGTNEFALAGATETGAMPDAREVTFTSPDGGRMQVEISGLNSETFSVKVLSATRTGTYSGSVQLDPDIEDGPTAEATVNVTHHWFWAFLAVLTGLAAAGLWTWLRDRERPKKMLRLHLRRAGTRYAIGRQRCPEPAGGDWMSSAFRLEAGKLGKSTTTGAHFGDKTLAAIEAGGDPDLLDDAEARVRDITELVRVWLDGCGVVPELRSLVDTHKTADEGAAVFVRAEELLEVTRPLEWKEIEETSLAEQATDFVNQRRDQAAAIKLYAEAREWKEKAAGLWKRLTRQEQDDVGKVDPTDPDSDWDTAVADLKTRQEWEAADVDQRMARRFAHYSAVLSRRDERNARMLRRPPPIAVDAAVARSRTQIELGHRVVESRSPDAILREIQTLDLVYFGWVASLAILIYFLTLFPDAAFGEPTDYLTAFLAAASGALVIDWALLPWFRSYRLPSAK